MTAIKNWIHPATPSDTVYFNFRVSEKMSCEKSFLILQIHPKNLDR
jgi:hypothetical protein